MTTGALIFAFNNEQTDYVAMAGWCARNIRRHLDIPVAIVTDCDPGSSALEQFEKVIYSPPESGGTRWFEDYQNTVTWHNAARINAYSQTPWDRTLVVDADYVVASSQLRYVLEYNTDFMCHRTAMNIATGYPLAGLNVFGDHNMPMWWATVMMFRKSNTAQYIFDCMQMIHANWEHYRALYGINNRTYRNDFALSIAVGIVSGQTGQVDTIPWPLMSALPENRIAHIAEDCYRIDVVENNQLRYTAWQGQDFHAMGKHHLENIIAAH
jgi:hypothetical protein